MIETRGGLENGAMRREVGGRLGRERLRFRRRRIADGDAANLDPLGRRATFVGSGFRDLLDDVEALGDASEDRVVAVERRLIGHADEELRAAAVGLARLQHRRHGAARVLLAADFPP